MVNCTCLYTLLYNARTRAMSRNEQKVLLLSKKIYSDYKKL